MPRTKTNILPKIFSCAKCGEAYGANPPDDLHTKASLDPHPSMDIDLLMVKAVPYECQNCKTITTLYWIDGERARWEQVAGGVSLTEEEYGKYGNWDKLSCKDCGKESFSPRMVSYGAGHLMVCENEKCRKVLAIVRRTPSGVISRF